MFKITGNQLLKIYLYFISFITLTVAIFSSALVFKSAISYISPIRFAYDLNEANDTDVVEKSEYELEQCYIGEPIEIEGNEFCWDEEGRKRDLVNSLSVLISMLILFGIHQYGIRRTEEKKTPKWLIKGYTVVSLLTYSIVGLVAIPTAIYQTINYLLLEQGQYVNYAPAYFIALAVIVLPFWYIFFNRMSKLQD